jgi:hypothetical protein
MLGEALIDHLKVRKTNPELVSTREFLSQALQPGVV